ncbi:MAG: hypothetical protein QGH39_08460, partial [Candidatus Thermoplasmatota archaeon]|nr:hypothetical protein [Candidatus Thermoplasmatota archaeon]
LGGIPLGRIHLNLEWVIREAGMIGDVEEENTFLVERYKVGNLFPVTLFFENRNVVKRVDGALTVEQLKDLFKDTFKSRSDEGSVAEGAVCDSGECFIPIDR